MCLVVGWAADPAVDRLDKNQPRFSLDEAGLRDRIIPCLTLVRAISNPLPLDCAIRWMVCTYDNGLHSPKEMGGLADLNWPCLLETISDEILSS